VGGSLPLVALDVSDSGKPAVQVEVALPEEVTAMIDDGPEASFRVSARVVQERVLVSWSLSKGSLTGVHPDVLKPPPPAEFSGVASIDFRNGTVEPALEQSPPGSDEAQWPDDVSERLRANSFAGKPWRAGRLIAGVAREPTGRTQRAILKRRDEETGKELPDVLLSGDGFIFRYSSADGRHLLASRPSGSAEEPWVWAIRSTESGEVVAEVRHQLVGSAFFVWGRRLVYESPRGGRRRAGQWIEEPLALRALDLPSSEQVWDRPMRDTAYRNAVPPGFSPKDPPR
jgi:hypothetical protein